MEGINLYEEMEGENIEFLSNEVTFWEGEFLQFI